MAMAFDPAGFKRIIAPMMFGDEPPADAVIPPPVPAPVPLTGKTQSQQMVSYDPTGGTISTNSLTTQSFAQKTGGKQIGPPPAAVPVAKSSPSTSKIQTASPSGAKSAASPAARVKGYITMNGVTTALMDDGQIGDIKNPKFDNYKQLTDGEFSPIQSTSTFAKPSAKDPLDEAMNSFSAADKAEYDSLYSQGQQEINKQWLLAKRVQQTAQTAKETMKKIEQWRIEAQSEHDGIGSMHDKNDYSKMNSRQRRYAQETMRNSLKDVIHQYDMDMIKASDAQEQAGKEYGVYVKNARLMEGSLKSDAAKAVLKRREEAQKQALEDQAKAKAANEKLERVKEEGRIKAVDKTKDERAAGAKRRTELTSGIRRSLETKLKNDYNQAINQDPDNTPDFDQWAQTRPEYAKLTKAQQDEAAAQEQELSMLPSNDPMKQDISAKSDEEILQDGIEQYRQRTGQEPDSLWVTAVRQSIAKRRGQ
jgi:hypothetical protein